MSSKDPCKKFACKLQKCLQENVYQPARCEIVIEELRQCCMKNSNISTVCDDERFAEIMKPQRKVLGKRSLLQRYPRAGSSIIVAGLLLIFYSRPLYDTFLRPHSEMPPIQPRR